MAPLINSLPVIRNFEHRFLIKSSRAVCWSIFTDWENWNSFVDVYGNLSWNGKPWAVGSRLKIELVQPIHAHIDHVIIGFEEGRKIGWLDHSLGVTMEQWITFTESSPNLTALHTWGEFVGTPSSLVIADQPVEQLVKGFIKNWYESSGAACERAFRGGKKLEPKRPSIGEDLGSRF